MTLFYLALNIITGGIALTFLFWLTRIIQETRDDIEDSAPALLERQFQRDEIRGGQSLLGRHPAADLVINDPRISTRQAMISYSNDRRAWFLNCLGRAMLRVDGQPIAQHTTTRLADGAVIELANGQQIVFRTASSKPAAQPQNFRLHRFKELRLLLLTSLFLFTGLLAADTGLRLDVLDRRQPAWNWLSLWLTFTSAWACIWLLMNVADWFQRQRHYATGQLRSHYPHQAILPMVALLIAVAALVGYRGEAVALSPNHAEILAASNFKEQIRLDVRMDEGDTQRMLLMNLYGIALALGLRIVAGSFVHTSQRFRRLVSSPRRFAQRILPARWQQLLRRYHLLALVGPIVLAGLSLALLIAEVVGLAPRSSGQLISVRGLGQPSEIVRLLIFFYMIWLVAGHLRKRLDWPAIARGLAGLAVSLVMYYGITKDLGPMLVSGIFALGLLLLPLERRTVVALAGGFFSILVVLAQLGPPQTLSRDSSFRQLRSWVSRPALNRTSQEYETFCNQPLNTALCSDDQSLRQAQYAVGLGGIIGAGPGRGSTIPPLGAGSNVYISNIHSDYVFIQILEEYGVLGGMLVLSIFFALCLYSLRLSQHLQSQLRRVIAAACGLWWAVQLLTIIGGTLRLLPLIGVPVPFVSYGRTAALVNGVVLGCLLATSLGAHVGYVDLGGKRQTSFAALRGVVTAGFLLVAFWFICGMYLVDRYIYSDLQVVAATTPDTAEYAQVTHPRQLGLRAQCLIRGYPQHNIVTADDVLLAEATRIFEGCDRYGQPDYSNAQHVGLAAALQDIQAGNTLFAQRLKAGNVKLTIDWTIQQQAYALLQRGFGSADTQPWGQALVMDVRPEREGQILALVDLTEAKPDRPPFQHGRYIPGSVFKVVTALAALRAGMTPTDEIDCYAGATIPERAAPVSNSLGAVNCAMAGLQTNLSYALAYSVNTFFAGLTDVTPPTTYPAESQLPLDRNQLLQAAQSVGMTEPDPDLTLAPYANFSLPMISSSVTGLTITDTEQFMHSAPKWADTAYGQGNIEVTIVQQAVLMQLIANNGVAATPRLIADATSPSWQGEKLAATEAGELRSILHDTVSLAQTSPAVIGPQSFSLAGASHVFDASGQQLVAGKTGTAEYQNAPPVSWFAGFAPFDQPAYVVVVMRSQQKDDSTDACSAAAIAGTIFDALLDAPQKQTCQERGN